MICLKIYKKEKNIKMNYVVVFEVCKFKKIRLLLINIFY